MIVQLEMTKANRLRIAQAFRNNPRVDIGIECVIEGQMGTVSVDDPHQPTVYVIAQGPFWYVAGDARSAAGYEMMRSFPVYALLMPSPAGWVEAARDVYGEKLLAMRRYSYSAHDLSLERLGQAVKQTRFGKEIRPIDAALAAQLMADRDSFVDLSAFDSAEDFAARGVGFCLLPGGRVAAAGYSSLVCSKGIEVSIFVVPRHRRRGIATALGSLLAMHCLERGLEPHWDAANLESCGLAEKLGYRQSGEYVAYYRRE